ncbi:MAG: FAD-dependent oxidoreductase [Planctomycetota bacterium]|nr:FAD-dependent oxidoreductase [Planctomycetota bacterium]
MTNDQIIIIGGGAVGCGVAYQLALAGETNVLLLEKESAVATATTSQAAGLVGQVRSSVERVQLAKWSVKTFSDLQQHENVNPSWRQVGSLRVALNDERVEEFKRLKATADEAELEVHFIDQAEAQSKWPALDFGPSKAVLWCPSDGYLQPYDLTMSYVAHCRQRGVRFQTSTCVTAILIENGQVVGVETDRGRIACRTVINAAGAHAYHIAKMAGIELPIVPVRHEFLITVHCDQMDPALPVVRIPDASLYLRAEVQSLLLGWEPDSMDADPRSYENPAAPPRIEDDYDVMALFAEQLAPQFPQIQQLGVRSIFKGWPTFTPDGRFIVGESCRAKGFVMAGGCNAHGVSGSAGIGRHVVESIQNETNSPYVQSLSPDRFTETDWNWDDARSSARRVYETYYGLDS